MNHRHAITPLPIAIVTLLLAAIAAHAAPTGLPAAGRYVGVATITRAVPTAGLSQRSTVSLEAKVDADGKITLLSNVPQTPTLALDIESAINRGVPLILAADTTAPGSAETFVGYRIDDRHTARTTVAGGVLTVVYRYPEVLPNVFSLSPYVEISFRLRKAAVSTQTRR